MKKTISVILSFYNEAEVIPELIERLRKTILGIDGYDYELIFVNDRSTDQSLETLQRFHSEDSRIKIITMARNFGVSECVLAGMAHAHGDAVVTLDTDLQDPPEVIPELVKEWEKGADVVYTVRTHRDGEPFYKLFLTRIGYWIIHSISSIDLPIESGDFKLISKRVSDHIVALKEKEPYLRGLVRWVGFKQVPVFYERSARFAGNTHFIIYRPKTIKNYLSGITSFSDVPLYMTFAMGISVSVGAAIWLLAVMIMKFLGWSLPGWTAIMATMLVLGATQSLAIGILGLYVAKVHNEVKRRPNYIVDSAQGIDRIEEG